MVVSGNAALAVSAAAFWVCLPPPKSLRNALHGSIDGSAAGTGDACQPLAAKAPALLHT